MNKYGLTDEEMKKWDEGAALHGKTGEELLEYYIASQREFFKDGVEAAASKILNGLTAEGKPFWISYEKDQ